MGKRLHRAIALLSTALAVLCAGEWIWSQFHFDEWRLLGAFQLECIAADGDLVLASEAKFAGPNQSGVSGTQRYLPGDRLWLTNPEEWKLDQFHSRLNSWNSSNSWKSPGFLGFQHSDSTGPQGLAPSIRNVVNVVALPFWSLAVVFAAIAFYFRRKCRPVAAGVCRVCGYDLRATPDRCPECGTVANVGQVSEKQA